jgi:prephenate dehydrogenase
MTVGIVGCGLIGGSIGLAMRAAGHRVLGFELDSQNAKIAQDRGCVDEIVSLAAAAQSDICFLCVPPSVIATISGDVCGLKDAETVVTDCTSIKAPVVEWLLANPNSKYVPGHPMAGHEKSGPKFASAWMFRGAKWLLTPVKATDKSAIKVVETAVKEIGAIPVRVSAEEHDREVALLSHLPHALAAVLVRLSSELESTEASAGSWQDLTRVGGADPSLWTEILIGNRIQVSKIIGSFQNQLDKLAQAIEAEDRSAVLIYLNKAKEAKERKV